MTKQRTTIIDGPDVCAKTHIAKELSYQLNIPTFKHCAEHVMFRDHPERFIQALRFADPFFVDYLKQSRASIIIDRGYPSEFVYSKAFKRETDEGMLEFVDKAHAALGTTIIICRRQSYTGIYDDKYPDRLGPHKLAEIDALYEEFINWTKCDVMTLYVDDHDLDRQINDILDHIGVW